MVLKVIDEGNKIKMCKNDIAKWKSFIGYGFIIQLNRNS